MSTMLGGTFAMMPTTLSVFDEEKSGLYRARQSWTYQKRSADLDGETFFGTWTKSAMASGDPGVPLAVLGADLQTWEIPDLGIGGMTRQYFINGQTLDSNGNGTASTVQAFLTATDAFVVEVGTLSTGYYSLPTIYTTSAHYLVAYKTGSPDTTGATVNTLIPVSTPA